MGKRRNKCVSGAMLDLWRPPQGAGDPIGCIASTYTFAPELFDEQCLARFLEIESEPNREDLAFLLERESRLGSVYAGVIVDHTQAGVEHSLRWDVLPVRIRAGKQHSKLTLLVWTRHIRVVVASANLTEQGYRINHEIAVALNSCPDDLDSELLQATIVFLRTLLLLVPGADQDPPAVFRARSFLNHVSRQVSSWTTKSRRRSIRQQLVVTLPRLDGQTELSALEAALGACRRRGESPGNARIASPFFDQNDEKSVVTIALCKGMARSTRRELRFAVPAIREANTQTLRLAAPKSLWTTPGSYGGVTEFEILPESDGDGNPRIWHAKMLALASSQYSALLVGSSNFTCAGMGIGPNRNAEANLLTIVERVDYGREVGGLESIWPDMERVADPAAAEWLGTQNENEEEEQVTSPVLPAGFLCAIYRAGDQRRILLQLDPTSLPQNWSIHGCGQDKSEILSASLWCERGSPSKIELDWTPIQPPEKLLVRWSNSEAFWPLNVEDSRQLPPPAELEQMSAEDMLWILAAADPSAAFRAWSKRKVQSDLFDPDLDSATPIELDPLRRHDLHSTFLHRVRRRARILAQLRHNLQRPVWTEQALEWRLRGLIGVESLAERLVREMINMDGRSDEALLTLADFLIVLREVDYQTEEGAISSKTFDRIFDEFLCDLVGKLEPQVRMHSGSIGREVMVFWDRVVERCRG